MWGTPQARLALLELLLRGTLKRRQGQATAFDALAELPWTRHSGRRDEIALVEHRRPDLAALIERAWPDWGDALAALAARRLPPTPEGWGRLGDARRADRPKSLPKQVNRRVAAAVAAPHSKAALTPRRLAALGGAEPTGDGLVRLRPPSGLAASTRQGRVDLSAIAAVFGEVAIPERVLREGVELEGRLCAVLLVENLGAWRDLPSVDGWLIAHVPGWDTTAALLFLSQIGPETPLVHFGDLDPNGVRILQHLRGRQPRLRWFIPSFWQELVETNGLPGVWPDDIDLHDAPILVRDLARRGLWLEQELLVVDQRIVPTLEAMLNLP